jgi:enoyl-CoA hydratase/carnithine racemase
VPVVPLADLLGIARDPLAHDALGMSTGGGCVVSDLRNSSGEPADPKELAHLACVLVAIGTPAHPWAGAFDIVVDHEQAVADVVAAVDANPIAATALALLLRGGSQRSVVDGLVAESATYSALQHGPEHRAWLAARAARHSRDDAPLPVRVDRAGDTLHITLNRPQVRNAYDAATRDAFLDALAIAANDTTITSVLIDGAGPSFCSGGDLDEFGTLADPASAHLLRVARSTARVMHELCDRTTVQVHGACVGAGVELPAFAARVVARADATFRLPEVSMGLVPGAGGTVSIPRRISRHRAAWMAITGTEVDATTAHSWRLVDDVVP